MYVIISMHVISSIRNRLMQFNAVHVVECYYVDMLNNNSIHVP